MDNWKFYDITHREHLICNPTSPERLDRLLGLLRLPPAANVLEIATGKGEFMTRLVERYSVTGVAVDLSPHHSQDARDKFAARIPNADVTMLEMDGAKYQPDAPESFDLTVCLGASWIYSGHKGTLSALKAWTKPGGLIAVGEPFWIKEPDPEFLAASGEYRREMFGTHYENVVTGQELDLRLLYTLVSSRDEWDNYYGLWWYAADAYAQANPNDPDLPELMRRLRAQQEEYLRWERNTLGWAIYLFRKA